MKSSDKFFILSLMTLVVFTGYKVIKSENKQPIPLTQPECIGAEQLTGDDK